MTTRVRSLLLALGATMALPCATNDALAQSMAYSLEDVHGLIESGVPPERILELTRRSCISFDLTGEVEEGLRRAGATPRLLTGLRTVCAPGRAPQASASQAARAPSGTSPAPRMEAPALPVVRVTTVPAAPPPPTPAARARRISEEAVLARELRSGVFRVIGNEVGLGFLVDSTGLILTHAQLLRYGIGVSVQVDSATHLPAVVLDVDEIRDVAVLAIDMGLCRRCRALPLFMRHDAPAAVLQERLLSVGSVLDGGRFPEVGLVREIRGPDILTDITATAPLTGGPLFNLDGEVIAINLARVVGLPGGERVGRSLLVRELEFTLARARTVRTSADFVPPPRTLLPVLSAPGASHAGAAPAPASADWSEVSIRSGPFTVTLMTAPWVLRRDRDAQRALERRRAGGRATPDGRVDPLQQWRRWEELVRSGAPGVVVSITPAVLPVPFPDPDRLTSPSRGDFAAMRLFRDGIELQPVERSRFPAVLSADELRAAGRPVIYQGVHLYRAEEFADASATWEARIWEAGASEPVRIVLPASLIERLRHDTVAQR